MNEVKICQLMIMDVALLLYMSVSSRSERRRNNYQQQGPSRVLLVCVYDTLVLDINNQVVYDKFRQFGNIIKILIFQKSEVTKFFIEYSEVEQAVNARNELDGSKLCDTICKMNIYFSNFSNVDLKNQTSEGADYTFEELNQTDFVNRYDLLTKSSPEEDTQVFNDLIMQSFDIYSPFARSKTDSTAQLSTCLQRLHGNRQASMPDQSEIDLSIRSNINSILESNSNSSKERVDIGNTNTSTPSKETNLSGQVKIKESSKSKSSVLCFGYERDIDVDHVYNLFSNFGNVSCITKKKAMFYVKFRTVEFAAISHTYLNNFRLMGNTLALDSPASEDQARPRQNQWCECIFFDSSFDRFTSEKSITINAPSVTLHVSSLKRDICKENILRDIFEEYGEVESVHILKQSADKNMALVKFYSIQDNFRAIASLHNVSFSGRKIQISFTKSRN